MEDSPPPEPSTRRGVRRRPASWAPAGSALLFIGLDVDGVRQYIAFSGCTVLCAAGAAARCAPSLGLDPFELIEGLHELLATGYAIAAADYPGLGVDGASSYLLGIPASNSMLDVARAARALTGTGARERLLLWDHSQGGQAALFAAERASSHAPELKLEGVAVAAPAANLSALMSADIVNLSGTTIASFAIPAYAAALAEVDTGIGRTRPVES